VCDKVTLPVVGSWPGVLLAGSPGLGIMRRNISSRALIRRDLVSMHHRLTGLPVASAVPLAPGR